MPITREIIKVVVDGRGGVGKTTMLKTLIDNNFDPYTPITVGAQFFSKRYQFSNIEVDVQFWDMAGVSRFDFLRPIFYKGAQCLILVGDLTRSTSFEDITLFIQYAKKAKIQPKQIILVGNKTDLSDRSIAPPFLTMFLEEYDLAELIETSARFGDNLEAIFELAVLISLYSKKKLTKNQFEVYRANLLDKIGDPVRYPTQKLERKCWICSRSLHFSEFSYTNSTLNRDRLIELWESDFLEFLCCNCYKQNENDSSLL